MSTQTTTTQAASGAEGDLAARFEEERVRCVRNAREPGSPEAERFWLDRARAFSEARDMARAAAPVTGTSVEQDTPVQWGDPKTVAGLIAQLRTLPPDAPIYGTFLGPDFPGEGRRRTGVRGVTLSREYVKGRWLSRDPDAELQHVIWTKPASPEPEAEEIAALTTGAAR